MSTWSEAPAMTVFPNPPTPPCLSACPLSCATRAQPRLFQHFLQHCRAVQVRDVDRIARIAQQTVMHLRKSHADRTYTAPQQALEQYWYRSLATGTPDYSVYATDDYLAELWACWLLYSRKYMSMLTQPKQRQQPYATLYDMLKQSRTILDLGCGLGYTTALFALTYPDACVTGTNLMQTPQARIAALMSQQYGFTLVESAACVSAPVDLVFASEYFEHFAAPIEHVSDVLATCQPTHLVIANAFNTHSIGHFDTYHVSSSTTVPAKAMPRLFNAAVRRAGYTQVETHCWNNRPALWRRRQVAAC